MIRRIGFLGMALLVAAGSAQAQGLNCAKFNKNADGSWSPREAMGIKGPTGTVQLDPREAYKTGKELPGIKFDLAAALDAQCR